MLKLTSRNNEKIKAAVKLRTDASERRKTGRFFLEGLRLCCDAAINGIAAESVFVTDNALNNHRSELEPLIDCGEEVFLITEDIALKLSDTKNPQGVFCVCKTIDKNCNIGKIKYNGFYIAAENVQTPGNLGAVARTAEALGLDGIIVSGGCDVYNPKALRAAMGSLLRISVFDTDNLAHFLEDCKRNGMKTYAAVPDASALPVTSMDKSHGVVCVVGNEGNGLSKEIINACSDKITIPMLGRAESLNAAAAACIVMWEMMR